MTTANFRRKNIIVNTTSHTNKFLQRENAQELFVCYNIELPVLSQNYFFSDSSSPILSKKKVRCSYLPNQQLCVLDLNRGVPDKSFSTPMAEDLAREIVLQMSELTMEQRQTIELMSNRMKLFNRLATCKCCPRHQSRRPIKLFDFTETFNEIPHILEDGTLCDFGKPGGRATCAPKYHFKCERVGNWVHEAKVECHSVCTCDCRQKMRKMSMCFDCNIEE